MHREAQEARKAEVKGSWVMRTEDLRHIDSVLHSPPTLPPPETPCANLQDPHHHWLLVAIGMLWRWRKVSGEGSRAKIKQ